MEHKDYEPILQDHVDTNAIIERRLTSYLMAYWERVRGDKEIPSEEDINPEDRLSDMWDDCFFIRVGEGEIADYSFAFIGQNVSPILVGSQTNETNMWGSLNTKRLAPLVKHVVDTKRPLINDGEMYNDANQLIKYRQCLLPVGEDDKVLAIFGGMRCKIYA